MKKRLFISIAMLLVSATLLFALPDPGQCLLVDNPGYGSLPVVTGDCYFTYPIEQFVGHTTECQSAIGWTCQKATCYPGKYCSWEPLL